MLLLASRKWAKLFLALCLLTTTCLIAPPAKADGNLTKSNTEISADDLWPSFAPGNRSDWRQRGTIILGTVIGAVAGYAIGGGLIGLAIGGVVSYFLAKLIAQDLFPNYATNAQWRTSRTFQLGINRPVDAGTPDTYHSDGYVGGNTNADLKALHQAYYDTLEAYQNTLRTGSPQEINDARNAYNRARTNWFQARGLNVSQPAVGW